MIERIITRNKLTNKDLQFILMVGGSTYIPFVRKRVEELLQIPINCEIDPTTAVGIGAAYFAGTKKKDFSEQTQKSKTKPKLQVRTSYPAASKDKEILFAAQFKGNINDLSYKITRDDGGFSSGTKPLQSIVNEELPLVESVFNTFTFKVYDKAGDEVSTDIEVIGINSGIGIGSSGNFLAHDICLETYDGQNKKNISLLVFEKNSTLPLRKKIQNEITRTIVKDGDDSLRINVLEGGSEFSPSANRTIGYFEITGRMLSRDIVKGSDIDILIEMSESRDLMVSAYVAMSEQEFKEVFNPKARHLPVKQLVKEIDNLKDRIDLELREATETEAYETAKAIKEISSQITKVQQEAQKLNVDDTTDKKYQLEDKKQKLAQELENATKAKALTQAKTEYLKTKTNCIELVGSLGNSYDQKALTDILSQEEIFLSSNISSRILETKEELDAIIGQVLVRQPEFKIDIFKRLVDDRGRMNNPQQANILFMAGKNAIEEGDFDRLDTVISQLIDLLPDDERGDYSDPGHKNKN
jgi:molecular chaperone DnaK